MDAQRARGMTNAAASDLYFVQEPVGEMANLAYLVGSRATREALLVDPAWNVASLLARAERDGMRVVGALATHYHQDHVGGSIFGMSIEGLPRLMELQPVPVHVQAREAEGVRRVTGLSASDLALHEGGDEIALGSLRIRLLHTPGHTPGSQCFLVEEAKQPARLVSGDTLFLNGCGRVDLPGGDPEAMYRSLNDVLKRLPDETLVYPGHLYAEPVGSLGEQKQSNPYLRVASLERFLGLMGF
jgi:glyoxylase-like metal-dependent hydrolase (beta-lactamase superfamily II)